MSDNKSMIGVKFDYEDRERIEKEARRTERTMSSLIRSIVLPEIKRREREREEEAVPA